MEVLIPIPKFTFEKNKPNGERVLPSVKFGRERDRRIVELIENSGPYTREQIQLIFFPYNSGRQKCVQRLGKLHQRGKVKRVKLDNGQYAYYTGKWGVKSEHALMVNWVYTALVVQRKSWLKILAFERDYTCKYNDKKLITDALLVLKNTAKDMLHPVFVEVDKDSSEPFEVKVKQYTELYESDAWTRLWWCKKDSEGFYTYPRILVVTNRKESVKNAIGRANKAGLKFVVVDLEQVKKDIYRYV